MAGDGTTQTNSTTELRFRTVGAGATDVIAVLALNRPEAANAFNDTVIKELIASLKQVATTANCRALVIKAQGKHFSAGADLAWMQAAAKLSYEGNIKDAELLIELFESLTGLSIPSIAVVNGAAYGGAVGLVAACDFAIASDSARFCLSEVKLGLLPAVILPYLARKIPIGQLRRQALSGRVFSAKDARDFQLVELVVTQEELAATLRRELNGLLQAAPAAQAALKSLMRKVAETSNKQGSHTAEAIAKARTGASGQAGLSAFFAKAPPPWVLQLDDSWEA